MTDWTRVIGFEKHTYVEKFPITSFLLAGVSNYQDTIKNINIDDILDMTFEPNNIYDNSAIVIRNLTEVCGYVPKDLQEKVKGYVPSKVQVIYKNRSKGIYSLRVNIANKNSP
jgi:hypothetical protein